MSNSKQMFPVKPWLCLLIMVLNAGLLPGYTEVSETTAQAQLEMGIDSRQQKYLRPVFRYDFSLPFASLFTEVMFYQRAGDKLKGAIDYWLNIGLLKKISARLIGEVRLNHMCRHLSSIENPDIFNLNELLARLWLGNDSSRLGGGYGIYIGGNQDYRSFLILNAGLPHIFGSELSFAVEMKIRDFREILYEAELNFSLSRSTDLFIRNTRHYDFENATYIGIRMKSTGKIGEYLEALKLSTGFYPYFESHKVLVEGEFRMMFFRNEYRQLLFSLDFTAPIIRDNGFLGDFYPENMTYVFNLEYEREIKTGWLVLWYARYFLNLPLDTDRDFQSDLGTGLGVRNQSDFDRLTKAIRFDVSAGYNFSHHYNICIKAGFRLFKRDWLDVHTDLRVDLSGERFYSSFRLFLNLGQVISIRPFIRFDRSENTGNQEPPITKFLFGLSLFKWYDE